MLETAVEYTLECWLLDYNTAFLNTDFTKDVYVKMVPGCGQSDDNGVPQVMRLFQSLYGLRQNPTNWWETIGENLEEVGFESFKSDPRIYTYSESGDFLILTLYVRGVMFRRNDLLVLRRIK